MNEFLFGIVHQFAGKWALLDDFAIICGNWGPELIAITLVAWWWRDTFASGPRRMTMDGMIFSIGISIVLALFINWVMNQLYWQPRPFVVHSFTPLIPHGAEESSFASDHAIVGFGVAWMVTRARMAFSWVFVTWVWVLVIAWSRVFAGVHYPIDMVGSFVISAILCEFVFRTFRKIQSEPDGGQDQWFRKSYVVFKKFSVYIRKYKE